MKNTLPSAPRQQCYSYKLNLYVAHIISSYDINNSRLFMKHTSNKRKCIHYYV